MAAKTKRELPLHQRRHVEDFTPEQLSVARQTIRLHLDDPKYQNTITMNEIEQYSDILDRHPTLIHWIVYEEEGEVVTLQRRAKIKSKYAPTYTAIELVGA